MKLLPSLILLAALGLTAFAAEQPDDTHTLSPYFLVKQAGETIGDPFPLKSTSVEVKIAGVIADVHLTQTYSNAAGHPLEATYLFPGSTRAAVHAMEMTIGERVLTAQIQPRAQAQQTYATAKAEGKSASLLEQQRPNVFQMSVANILPGETVRVDLHYTELLVPTAGEYEFIFPTVVGPRYSSTLAAGVPSSAAWVANPYLHKGESTASGFQLRLDLATGLPVHALKCSSHEITPEYLDASHARLQFIGGQDRDFILHYRLAEDRIESGLLLSEGEKENFFLLTVQPPPRAAAVPRPPREYLFVIDVSGSMSGFPLETAKELMRRLFATLKPADTFNVLLFSGGSTLLSPVSLPATPEHLAQAIATIDQNPGGGGTELLPALEQTFALPKIAQTSRSVVVITDGFIDAEPAVFDLIRARLGEANLFAFGIGSSVNRHLIEGMARAGQGEPFIVTKPEEALAQTVAFRTYIEAPLLTAVTASFDGFDAYDIEPAAIPDLLAARPIVVQGKWRGKAGGTIRITGRNGAGEYRRELPVASAQRVEGSQALDHLWARQRIASLSDYEGLRSTPERIQQITSLGLTYHLLTAHTSFVAVDSIVRNPGAAQTTTPQPLPLPQGVENSAVGSVSSTPEPTSLLLLLALAPLLALARLRSRSCE